MNNDMERKYQIDTDENRLFLKEMTGELLDFGKNFPSPGGGSWYLEDDGTPRKEHPRETWITARMAHVYSIGTILGYAGSKELAESAVEGLRGELHDDVYGGWYAGLTSDNGILPSKQCYAHAFVMLAASSAVLAGIEGADDLLKNAVDIYDKKFWNEDEGLACDTWNTEFTVLDDYRGLNSNMHSVEAFMAIADATGDAGYRERAGRVIRRIRKWAENNEYRIPEHYTKDWEIQLQLNIDKKDDQFKPYGATPGHGIEWSRLILQWALSMFRKESKEYADWRNFAEKLYERAVSDGWNADGAPGIVYTTDWEGRPVVHDRMHWTLAEAINTSACLYGVTKNPVYAQNYSDFMKYLDKYVRDKKNGSWFHQLSRNNEVIRTVWPGKPDIYHAFQATLIPYHRADMSIAAACKSV